MDSGVLKAGLRWFPAAGSARRQMDPATNSQRTLLNNAVELQSAEPRLCTADKAGDSQRCKMEQKAQEGTQVLSQSEQPDSGPLLSSFNCCFGIGSHVVQATLKSDM